MFSISSGRPEISSHGCREALGPALQLSDTSLSGMGEPSALKAEEKAKARRSLWIFRIRKDFNDPCSMSFRAESG